MDIPHSAIEPFNYYGFPSILTNIGDFIQSDEDFDEVYLCKVLLDFFECYKHNRTNPDPYNLESSLRYIAEKAGASNIKFRLLPIETKTNGAYVLSMTYSFPKLKVTFRRLDFPHIP